MARPTRHDRHAPPAPLPSPASGPASAHEAAAERCVSDRGAQGCGLQLSVMPNAKRTQADGLHDGALRVRLAAPPIDGRANEALVAWLSGELGVPKRDIEVGIGASGRRKRVDVALPAATVRAWVARLLAEADASG